MQVLFKLLRSHGVLLPSSTVNAAQWTVASLGMGGGACHLALRPLMCRPDQPPIAELYNAVVKHVDDVQMVLRGVERVDADDRVATVVQEWCLKQPPALGAAGLHSPAALGIAGWAGKP